MKDFQRRTPTMYYYCYWKDHVHQIMTGCDPETLTMSIEDHEDDRKSSVIERLIKRQKYKAAFHVATYFHIPQ